MVEKHLEQHWLTIEVRNSGTVLIASNSVELSAPVALKGGAVLIKIIVEESKRSEICGGLFDRKVHGNLYLWSVGYPIGSSL